MIKQLIKKLLGRDKFNSVQYWETRYADGGNSGDGSYGRLSVFKAEFINKFLEDKKIQSAIELGCGDGHQLSIIHYPQYTGMDVSSTILELCKKKFEGDTTKKFVLYKPDSFVPDETLKADLALSLDVLYHIVEEKNYLKYMQDLFSLGNNYVIVYSTNFYMQETQHVLHRKFTDDINRFPGWKLIAEVKNPFQGNGEQESMADFFVFQKYN
jgi:SAM-dependent methyltransferase